MLLRLFSVVILGMYCMLPAKASALTTEQFFKICQASPGVCEEHPILQAYVGGALDMLAALSEETQYLDNLYCKAPKDLFDISAIMRFMQAHSKRDAKRNAMLLVIRYFEQNGGCVNHDR